MNKGGKHLLKFLEKVFRENDDMREIDRILLPSLSKKPLTTTMSTEDSKKRKITAELDFTNNMCFKTGYLIYDLRIYNQADSYDTKGDWKLFSPNFRDTYEEALK